VVFEVICRTMDADGQNLLVPALEAKEVIALHHQHGTSEQFHSENKTDLDLERLPSGKFATNATMLSLGLVAYNLLRLCGQQGLKKQRCLPPPQAGARSQGPRPNVFRRRLRSVMEDLMCLAAKLTWHANRWKLVFWQNASVHTPLSNDGADWWAR